MGKVVIGGSGNVAREVVDAILARGNHEVVVFTRGSTPAPADFPAGVAWKAVDYNDLPGLASALAGVDTVLSFCPVSLPGGFQAQKNLLDAAIVSGVMRFAPSEWATSSNSGVAHYKAKDEFRLYLEELKKQGNRIEYCLFQPGFFTNYFAHPHATAKHFHLMPMCVDFEHRRAIIIGEGDYPITLTTVEDMAAAAAEALDYPGQWPTVGGMRGTQITVADLIALGEKLRGPFTVERLAFDDVVNNNYKTSWVPYIDHPAVPVEHRDAVSRRTLHEYLIALAKGSWTVSNEWNGLLKHKFASAEDYLTEVWKDRA